MKKERTILPLADIELNEGQLGWLPKNPREWTQGDLDRTTASIERDPDFLEDRPILVVKNPASGRYVAFCGNMRREGARDAGMTSSPSVIYTPESEEDRETVIRRAMLDNGTFGRFDWDEVANSDVWSKFATPDYGIPSWPQPQEGAAREGDGSSGGNSASGDASAQEDDFDEEEDEINVRCKKGDIWQLGDHRLMCGDSTDLETVKLLMGGGVS